AEAINGLGRKGHELARRQSGRGPLDRRRVRPRDHSGNRRHLGYLRVCPPYAVHRAQAQWLRVGTAVVRSEISAPSEVNVRSDRKSTYEAGGAGRRVSGLELCPPLRRSRLSRSACSPWAARL